MRFVRKISTLALATSLTALACSNSDGPTSIEIPIAMVKIRSGCAILEGGTCSMVAEAKTPDGVIVSNPVLRWNSSNAAVASVQGESSTAIVRGHSIGSAEIIVTNTTGDASDSERVTVVPCTKC